MQGKGIRINIKESVFVIATIIGGLTGVSQSLCKPPN